MKLLLPATALLALLTLTCANPPYTPSQASHLPIPDTLPNDPKQTYSWPGADTTTATICTRFHLPQGYKRIKADSNTFAIWLRHLPLLPPGTPVKLHNGQPKRNQQAHVAVINIDPGKADLQQCADAVMRLRAEYLFAQKRYAEIAFNFTSGDRCDYLSWCKGERIDTRKKGKRLQNGPKATVGEYTAFRRYMNDVFMYAGTLSLSREMKAVPAAQMQIGDVFIKGGSPGHACIVADMAENEAGEKIFLLLQSYMPAQNIQVLHNPAEDEGNPWYSLNFGDELNTPEWKFERSQLKRF
ncbi:MAG: DUF4846 domain-containing protein [Bacteroidia bacterium]|jgi:hypothetical protein|nr:DUF4846 domain-containing protein [Bacteroidia bacterium]